MTVEKNGNDKNSILNVEKASDKKNGASFHEIEP